MNLAAADRIVNALLYEGYMLYPYRSSAVKNQIRFNFGVLYPKAYAEAQSGNDAWTMQTECLVSGNAATSLRICVRFLRIVERTVHGADAAGSFLPVASLRVGEKIFESWQEAAESSVDLPARSIGSLSRTPLHHEFRFLPESDEELLRDSRNAIAGAIRRTRESLEGWVDASAERVADGVFRLRVRVANAADLAGDATRDHALKHSLVSTHTILGADGGEFVSLLEPPGELRDAAAACRNEGAWPVLVGAPGEKNTVLSSPIILYDYPAVAPESPGELFDSTEIDEILTLRILTMTDVEKEEMRRIDDRARRILERAESLAPEQFAELHGALRNPGVPR